MTHNQAGTTKRLNRHDPKDLYISRFIQLGYNDALAGKPFRPEYEQWPKWEAANYERGRLEACNIRAAGLPMPKWHPSVIFPQAYREVREQAAERIGRAVPDRARDGSYRPQNLDNPQPLKPITLEDLGL